MHSSSQIEQSIFDSDSGTFIVSYMILLRISQWKMTWYKKNVLITKVLLVEWMITRDYYGSKIYSSQNKELSVNLLMMKVITGKILKWLIVLIKQQGGMSSMWMLVLFSTHCGQLISSWLLYSLHFGCCTLQLSSGAFCCTL